MKNWSADEFIIALVCEYIHICRIRAAFLLRFCRGRHKAWVVRKLWILREFYSMDLGTILS